MSRTLRRPMFRRGGDVNDGIMTGIVDRSQHAENPIVSSDKVDYEQMFLDKVRKAGGPSESMDPLTAYLLQAGPAMMSTTGHGGTLANLVASTKDPNKMLIERAADRDKYERDLRTGAAQFGLEKDFETSQLEKKIQGQKDVAAIGAGDSSTDLFNYFRDKELDQNMELDFANNVATYETQIKKTLKDYVDESEIGGMIRFDINDDKQMKAWLKANKKTGKNKYYYDPKYNVIRKLVEHQGELKFQDFDINDLSEIKSVESIDDGNETLTSASEVTLTYEDAQSEADKRGLVLLPERPVDAGRGWLINEKKKNPNAVTVFELEELIEKENFAKQYENIKKKKRSGTR